MPGKIGARSRNPVGPTRNQVREASELFSDFTGDAPEYAERVKLRVPKTGLVVGDLDGILYTTVRDGETESYIHKFKRTSRPLLVSSHDGKSLHIIGGKYVFTERGIEDE